MFVYESLMLLAAVRRRRISFTTTVLRSDKKQESLKNALRHLDGL